MKIKTTLRALDELRYQAEQENDWNRIREIDEQTNAILAELPDPEQEQVDAMHEAAKEAFAIPEDSPV